MAKLVFGLHQSLDGFVDHRELGPPDATVFQHVLDHVSGLAGLLYGRQIYEIMQYWDEDQPDWDKMEHDYAAVWRSKPKWVVSHALKSVGPSASLIEGDFETAMRRLKADVGGEIAVGGPKLAQSLTDLGLIDEYRLYLRPVVLGGGTPFFAGKVPPLRFVGSEPIGASTVRLTYAPA